MTIRKFVGADAAGGAGDEDETVFNLHGVRSLGFGRAGRFRA
jgi:hypothetical protein